MIWIELEPLSVAATYLIHYVIKLLLRNNTPVVDL